MGINKKILKAIAGEGEMPNVDDKYLGENAKLLKKIYEQMKKGGNESNGGNISIETINEDGNLTINEVFEMPSGIYYVDKTISFQTYYYGYMSSNNDYDTDIQGYIVIKNEPELSGDIHLTALSDFKTYIYTSGQIRATFRGYEDIRDIYSRMHEIDEKVSMSSGKLMIIMQQLEDADYREQFSFENLSNALMSGTDVAIVDISNFELMTCEIAYFSGIKVVGNMPYLVWRTLVSKEDEHWIQTEYTLSYIDEWASDKLILT